MASSGTLISHKYGVDTTNTPLVNGNPTTGAHYSFEWTSSQTSPGVTTVYWKLWGRGRYDSPRSIWNHVRIDVVVNGATFTACEVTANYNGVPDSECYFNDYLRREGSFTVEHSSDGAGSFQVAFVDFWVVDPAQTYNVTRTAALDNYPICTVYYNANGGSSTPNAQSAFKGASVTLASAITRTNTVTTTFNPNGGSVSPASRTSTATYPFGGWETGGVVYSAGVEYVVTADGTMTAQWGTATGESVSLPTPIRNGYTFTGWYTTASGGTKVTSYNPTASTTLYAQWSPNTYYVTYDANGGTGAPTTQPFVFNSGTKLSTTIPTRTGYTFEKWVSNPNNRDFAPGDTIPNGYGSFTLVAQWKVIYYTITYHLDGGVNPDTAPISYTVNDAIILPTPTRSGYTFAGWLDGGGNIVSMIPAGSTGNKSFTATWKPKANLYCKVDGHYKEGPARVKHNGVWHEGKQIYRKINGKWKLKE